MSAKTISVTLAIGSDPYQQSLPAALLREGMLRRVLSFRPEPEVADPNGAGSLTVVRRFPAFKLANRVLWAAWRRLPGTGQSHLPKVATTWLADRLALRFVPPSSIFHGVSGTCLASMRAARRSGAVALLESPTLHLRHWQSEVSIDCERFGVNPRDCSSILPAPLIRRVEREYELCDKIIALSSPARQSFVESGYGQKTLVVLPGVDHVFFTSPPEPKDTGLFRVCYVGRIEVAKGIGYLLEAWTRLRLPRAELLLAGEIRPDVEPLLKVNLNANLMLPGALPLSQVVECYRQSDVLVLPSANEGLGMVLLEAMACGIPVIATDRTGATDVVTEGVDGFVVPARKVEVLAERILWCYEHREQLRAMGAAARIKVEERFTLDHYERRLTEMYRQLSKETCQTTASTDTAESRPAR